MKKTISMVIVVVFMGAVLLPLVGAIAGFGAKDDNINSIGTIKLYGVTRRDIETLEKELEIYKEMYDERNLRDLFLEMPYFTANLLNIWMSEDDDIIFNQVFDDLKGSYLDSQEYRQIYIDIKNECPETIFHGVDVGKNYDTTGKRYLKYLENNKKTDSIEYEITNENINQGIKYESLKSEKSKEDYAEKMMYKNFIREFDNIKDKDALGIFESKDVKPAANIFSKSNLYEKLKKRYTETKVKTYSLVYVAKNIKPTKVEMVEIIGNMYRAEYYGREDVTKTAPGYKYREFWHIENANEDFIYYERTGNMRVIDEYPMNLEVGEIYMIVYTTNTGAIEREIHRYKGEKYRGTLATEELVIIE